MRTKSACRKDGLVPPDGGWGWVVSLAYGLNNVIVLPLISGFGLIFQETFTNMGINATGTSIIIIVNYAFGMVLSLFNGPLLKSFGYRKVALVGSVLISVGIILTAKATSFVQLILTYSIMTSVGIALTMSSFSLAINSFFDKKRGRAMAIGMSLTGLGPILMPQIITALLSELGAQGAILVLGALSMHSIPASLLLRPIKWYLKKSDTTEIESGEANTQEIKTINHNDAGKTEVKDEIDYVSENEEDYLECILNEKESINSISNREYGEKNITQVNASTIEIHESSEDLNESIDQKLRKSNSNISKQSNSEDMSNYKISLPTKTENDIKEISHLKTNGISNILSIEEEKLKKKTFKYKIVKFFDLGLLSDPIFVNIMLGISLAACAEINFTLLTPFILNDLRFTTNQIATIMSVIAFTDIIFRFLSPFIGDWCKKSARVMYIVSLIMLIFVRSTILFTFSYEAMIVVALGLGISKGIRTVYMNLVMPNYVPIERLAFASGIQMITNGLILVILGPILGFIRDKTGSYNISIFCINIFTAITIVMWSIEFVYVKYKKIK